MTILYSIYGYLALINLVTFFAYGFDKLSAASQAHRVRERTLLILALLGGTPAAILAMKFFRHKTIKPVFQLSLAIILLIQLVIIAYFLKTNSTLTNHLNSLY